MEEHQGGLLLQLFSEVEGGLPARVSIHIQLSHNRSVAHVINKELAATVSPQPRTQFSAFSTPVRQVISAPPYRLSALAPVRKLSGLSLRTWYKKSNLICCEHEHYLCQLAVTLHGFSELPIETACVAQVVCMHLRVNARNHSVIGAYSIQLKLT